MIYCSCCHREVQEDPDWDYSAVLPDGSELKICVFCYVHFAKDRRPPDHAAPVFKLLVGNGCTLVKKERNEVFP